MEESDNLKQFIIPKRKISASEVLIAIDQNCIEYKNDILEVIEQHSKHKDSLEYFTFHNPYVVQNPVLLGEFNEKRKLMKELCNDKELKCSYAFTHLDSRSEAERICREGLYIGNSDLKSLGEPDLGVYVCKYSDILPPSMTGRVSFGHLVIFKLIKGKVKTMVENKTGDALEPTPSCDCHVVKSSNQMDEYESSQIYVYEYDNNMEVLERPRHLLPFALVTFKLTNRYGRCKQYKIKKYSHLPPTWSQPYSKGIDNEAKMSDDLLPKKHSNHSLNFHHKQPFVLWSGSMIISNRIICSINMYSDHLVSCPFYLGADIKLNSEFKTDKLFSHFFLDKLSHLNKKEFTLWNNIYYTYVKLRCTESMVFKFLKVANYLQDKDSSFLCSVDDSVKLIVVPNCKQAERLGLDDPSYMHAVFVSNTPHICAGKSGHQQTLRQIVENINKTIQPVVINKSDPRQMKKLLTLRASTSTLGMLYQENATEVVESLDSFNEPAEIMLSSSSSSVCMVQPIRISPTDVEMADNSASNVARDSEKTVSDADHISEIENDLEQDIIKLKLTLKTLSLPYMSNLEFDDDDDDDDVAAAAVDDDDDTPLDANVCKDTGEKQVSEQRTVSINKETRVNFPAGFEADDGIKVRENNSGDVVDHNYKGHEIQQVGDHGQTKDKHEDEDDDDMDDDLADQIVLKCLQPSFMSPHIKLDSLGNIQNVLERVEEVDTKENIETQCVDLPCPVSSAFTMGGWTLDIKQEVNVKAEPLWETANTLKQWPDDDLESGEIPTSAELSFCGKVETMDEIDKGINEVFLISDDETEGSEGSSIIIVNDLCMIPTERMFDLTTDSDNDMPSIIYDYGDDGRLIYKNIRVKVTNDSRMTEIREDELHASNVTESTLNDDILSEVFEKAFKEQHQRNIRYHQNKGISISSGEECDRGGDHTQSMPMPSLSPPPEYDLRKVKVGSPSSGLKEMFSEADNQPMSDARKVEAPKTWENFLATFISERSSEDHDLMKDLKATFKRDDGHLSQTFQNNSMPRFYRPVYVYKPSIEEIQETFGRFENEDQDKDEEDYSSNDINFYDERKRCATMLDEWISEKSQKEVKGETGICNLRWFQSLNRDCETKVAIHSTKKTSDDFVASHYFFSSMEDEVSRSGIPFLEDLEEMNPSSDLMDGNSACAYDKQDEFLSWPSKLHAVDVIPARHSIQRKVLKDTPRVFSLKIYTFKDPRLAQAITSDSIYWTFLNGSSTCIESDVEDINITHLSSELENLIVTIYPHPSSSIGNLQMDEKILSLSNSKVNLEQSTSTNVTKGLNISSITLTDQHFQSLLNLQKSLELESSKLNQPGNLEILNDSVETNGDVGNICQNHEIKPYFLPEILRNNLYDYEKYFFEHSLDNDIGLHDKNFDSYNYNMDGDISMTQDMHSSLSGRNGVPVPNSHITNKRTLDKNKLGVCKKSKHDLQSSKSSFHRYYSCKRNILNKGIGYRNLQSKCYKFCKHKKFKSPINFTHVCKSCKKFFINKYLRCHSSISQHAAENKDSFLINAILSLLCFKHLKKKYPHDFKKSSKFLAYFKDASLKRKKSVNKNYIQLEKLVGNMAKHIQRSNTFRHSVFLSALALNYHSQNFKSIKDSCSQTRQDNENIDSVILSSINAFNNEMDKMLVEMACIPPKDFVNEITIECLVLKKKLPFPAHFSNLSHFSKDVYPIKTSVKRKVHKTPSSCSLEDILNIQEKAIKVNQTPNTEQKYESASKLMKITGGGCASRETIITRSPKTIKLTATGGKLIHSKSTSSYLPDFLKVRSRPLSTSSSLCRVSSSDEILCNSSDGSKLNLYQDLSVCSSSSSENQNVILPEDENSAYVNNVNYDNSVNKDQFVENNYNRVSSDRTTITDYTITKCSSDLNQPYNVINDWRPTLQNYQTFYQPYRPVLHYPWNNVILTVQNPTPMMGLTYPMLPTLSVCNTFIPNNIIPPPLPGPRFYPIPPPFFHKIPPSHARSYIPKPAPPELKKALNCKIDAFPKSEKPFSSHIKRIYVFNKDRSLSHNIEKFLQFKGALTFDPFNIVMLRNVQNIQCFVLVHFQDLDKLDKIPNILQLKKDLRVQFVIYRDVHDVKFQKFKLIFPKGGVLVIEDETFLSLEADVFKNICESLSKQMNDNAKPWRLILSGKIKNILEDLKCENPMVIQLRYKSLLDIIRGFEQSGLIHIPAESSLISCPQKNEEYLKNCLSLQSSHCFNFRHFLFLTEKLIGCEDSLKFKSRGIDILTVNTFARGFLSMIIKTSSISSQAKQKTCSDKYSDALLSSAAKHCTVSL